VIEHFIDYKKCIPDEYVNTVYDIDYLSLYNKGLRVIFFDLDNTLISYKEETVNQKAIDLINNLKTIGYEIMLVSNNSHKKRVAKASRDLNIDYVNFAIKPLKHGFKKAMKKLKHKYNSFEVLQIGDQLLTDVYGSRRMKFYTILVDAIDHKSEILATKINRRREKNILNKIKKKDNLKYSELLERYELKNL
jgi:uncharacterized protein